jgi:beta-fructofuranosidase
LIERKRVTSFFYKPDNAWSADFIPFYENGRYHLFYLLDWRDRAGHGEGTPWYQLSTQDLVHFDEHGCMLERGTEAEQDLYVFTGSVIRAEGRYHIFYTGHNPHYRKEGKAEQAVMHAVSDDLLTWQKIPEDSFFAPGDVYEAHDWRDPFVFWNEESHEYWMLLAARLKSGPSRQRGCTALCASKDLQTWEVREPLWSPGLYFTHECPDLFRMGDWWYLIFSEFSDAHLTRYCMSRSLAGPWLAPADDAFDGRAYYAAKTASDGERRLLFGWNPTREGETDEGRWQWGGNLVVHELVQQVDGTLTTKVPAEVEAHFAKPIELRIEPRMGDWQVSPDRVAVDASDRFAWCRLGEMPTTCRLETTITFDAETNACGLVLCADAGLDHYYQVRLEPHRQRLVFDRWPRPGDQPMILERPLSLRASEPVHLQVFADGTIFEIYVDGRVALSVRGYAHTSGDWGLFVKEGAVTFAGLGCGRRR